MDFPFLVSRIPTIARLLKPKRSCQTGSRATMYPVLREPE